MEKEKNRGLGILGIIAVIILGIGVFDFIWNYLLGPYRDYEDDEWVSRGDMIEGVLYIIAFGILLLIIDQIRQSVKK